MTSIETLTAVLLMDVAKFLIFYNTGMSFSIRDSAEKELSFVHAYLYRSWDKSQSYMNGKENAGLRNKTKANYFFTRLFILK